MKYRFKKEDIGKSVLLYLDPKKNKIAKALGANKVEVYGEIVGIGKNYVEILKIVRRYAAFRANSSEKIPYSSIKKYKFMKYIRDTSKTQRIIRIKGKTQRKVNLENIN